ncbi:MAG: C25 family cysteine peptidase [Candidatus Kapaibacterium sp.]
MKPILYILLLFTNVCLAQNSNWITPNKSYLKLYVVEDGIYRLTKSDFVNAGVNTSTIDPRTVKVYYKGSQISAFFFGEQNGVFDDTDYLDFYGQRNYGGNVISYKEQGNTNVPDYITDEYFNMYSDTSVYWVGWDGAHGLRYIDYNFNSANQFSPGYFSSPIHFEYDNIYSLGERRNSSDYRHFNNEKISGEGWYWREMNRGNVVSDTFRTPFLSDISQTCSLKVFAYPNSYVDSIFNEHRLIVRVNGNIIDTIKTDNYKRIDTVLGFSSSLLSASNLNQISFTYTGAGTYVGVMLFDNFSLQYPRKFILENNRLNYAANLSDTSGVKFMIAGANSSLDLNIYDVKNNLRVLSSSFIIDTLFFTGKLNGKYEIINNIINKKPFRIKQRSVSNLVTNSIGADYMIVYNKLLESSAEILRQHRASKDSFRALKFEIEEIYDVFNYGIESPLAVRYFVKNVYDNWQQPKVKYLCLFGRGSLDPKRNSGSSIYYQNLIPVYGNPPSDGYFANFNIGAFTYFHQISVGRIPALTNQEGSDIVNNIIQYENQSSVPSKWFKNFVFITGGQNIQEQIQFANQSNYFINTYIKSVPNSGYPIRIFRNDSTSGVTFNYQDSIKNAINTGASITNYIGHAASSNWDNGLDDPNVLTNQLRMPVVFSMTCFTGKNAETETRSFGEKFINMPNKGAIGFIGSTGWSFSFSGNTYNEYLIKSFTKDTVRRIGDIVRYASKTLSSDSLNFAARNTVNCYGMIGDPAVKLLMPQYPEYAISPADYKFSSSFPSIREIIKLSVCPSNLGIFSDSMKISFTVLRNGQTYRNKDTIIRNFGLTDTVSYSFVLDSAGSYAVKVKLDPNNWNTKEIKDNNEILIPIFLKNISFIPLKPIDNQIVFTDSVEIVGINPNLDVRNNNIKLILQVDTSRNYNSSFLRTYFMNNPTGLVTKFKVPINRDTNIVYYFRLNAVINSDSSGWSNNNRFIVGINSENNLKILNPDINQIVTIYKKNYNQYNSSDLLNIAGSYDSLTISRYIGNIVAQSWGNNLTELTSLTIGNTLNKYIDSAYWGGLILFKINKTNSKIQELEHFNFSTNQANDSVLSYLNSFDDKHILVILKASPFNTNFGMNSSLRSKIKLFGSTSVDSVNLQNFSTWSFISYSQFPNVIKSENYSSVFAPAVCSMQPLFYHDSGYVYHNIIAAESYNSFKWSQTIPSFTNLYFDVLGLNRINQYVLLYKNLTSNSNVSIDTIKSSQYPGLQLITKLYIDSINGTQSPVFNNFKFTYTPAPEIIADTYSFNKNDSVFNDGDTMDISVNYGNYGYAVANGFLNKWYSTSPTGLKLLRADSVNSSLKIDSLAASKVKLSTIGLRNPNKKSDTISLYFETSLLNNQNEFYTYNNTAVTRVVITGDTAKPVMDITYDGINAVSGEYIASKPRIVLKFYDDSKIFIKDTSNIRVQLDDVNVWYYINGVKNPIIDLQFPDDKFLQATLFFNPELSDGEHKFRYISYDQNNNFADTVIHYMTVNPDLKIVDLKNYPNPMKNETSFLINLSGNMPPSNAKIKIFTIAGRLIKTIESPLNIGFNQISWDGRDADGDYLANGVYFYKLIIEGSKKETSLQKLVVLK